MLPAKCDTDLLLQQVTRMLFGVFKICLPLWTWDFRKDLSGIPFAMVIPVQLKLK